MTVRKDSTARRIKKRSLPELLVYKFLIEHGYDYGPVIARAIVDDILATIERCYADWISPKIVIWLAVRVENGGRGKAIDVTNLVPGQLKMYAESEVNLLIDPGLRKKHRTHQAFNRVRFACWCFEACERAGVLTLLDLSLVGGLSTIYASRVLREYEKTTGEIVPTRGTVHDLGPSVTHKAEVVRRWLRHQSPVEIA